jgi:hypothetical protein
MRPEVTRDMWCIMATMCKCSQATEERLEMETAIPVTNSGAFYHLW